MKHSVGVSALRDWGVGQWVQRYRDLSHTNIKELYGVQQVLISSLIWVGVGGSSPQIISSTIFCVDELPNVQRFPHMILNSIFCMDEFPNVPKYAYDDCLTKLTVFGVVRDK